jgi:hypothetical protein
MKTTFSFSAILSIFFAIVLLGSCSKNNELDDQVYFGNIGIQDGTEIPLFAPNTIIEGNVVLKNENGTIPDLSSLKNVIEIDGFFEVGAGITDDDLANLSNLQKTKTLSIGYNELLTDLSPLEGLEITESFTVIELPEVTTIPQFFKTTMLEGNFSVFSLPKLTTFNSFPNLQEVNGFFSIQQCDALESIDLPFLTKVDVFRVRLNPQLTAFTNISLNEATSELDLSFNPKVTTLAAFLGFQKTNMLTIDSNDELQSLAGFQQLEQVSNIRIAVNEKLDDFCAIANALQNSEIEFYTVFENAANPTQTEIIEECL